MKTSRIAFVASLLASLPAVLFAQVPQLLNYQGRLAVGGTNFNGSGQFKFALVDGAGTTSYWSNNGSSAGGSEPSAAVALSVANGLYSVALGDTALPNMTAVPSTVFNNSDVRLRIWFNDGVNGSQLLTPDQRIASVGYAMMAANVPNGAITADKLANGAVTADKIAAGAINTAQVADNGITSAKLADDLDLGSSMIDGRLDIFKTSAGTAAISLIGNSSQISTYGSDGLEQARLWGPGWGELLLHDNTTDNNTTAQLLAHETVFLGFPFPTLLQSPGGALKLTLGSTNRVYLKAGSSGGQLSLYQNDGGLGVLIDGDDAGAGSISVRSTNGSTRVLIDGLSTSGGGEVSVNDFDGTKTVQLLGSGTAGGSLNLFNSDGAVRASMTGSSSSGGYLYLYANDGSASILADGDSGGAGYISVRNNVGSSRVVIDGETTSGGGGVYLYNAAGASTISLLGDSSGEGRIVTQVLQITGGSDLSEQFDIKAIHDELKAGMIVSIDPENPGRLLTSTRAYDKTVAGVVSGAGGVKPGMMMGQQGTAADGKHPVALTGRVYCWVDAANGAVQPGDMITTSDTPGHGMKVTDHNRAQGAIIGKAMSSLASGRGLVLVLVSLQ
jgi:hypothetical protein